MSEAAPPVSAIFLCYNCEAFVADALRSVLCQDCDPIEIIVSDDASEDGTFEAVESVLEDYRGPHRVQLRRRSTTSGCLPVRLIRRFPTSTPSPGAAL